jgi:Arc/MetJ-type ribon-helix-helix transcriptional regulator
MANVVKTHIVKVTGVPEELLRLLDDRVNQRHYAGRAEYLRELLRRDLLPEVGEPGRRETNPGTPEQVESAFNRIDQMNQGKNMQPLSQEAFSAEHIYGDRA